MKKTFIRTKNVKQFVSLMDELQKVPPNIPKKIADDSMVGRQKRFGLCKSNTRNDKQMAFI